jgi:ubiquinone/menaquinone biosynthesis C-methylase UbiE
MMTELRERYSGEAAKKYEAIRAKGRKWQRETTAVTEILSKLPRRSTLLDSPVGTGRFVPLYREFNFKVVGVDISDDMLAEARAKIAEYGADMIALQGDALDLQLPDGAFQAGVCMRFFNWLAWPEVEQVFGELSRVVRSHLILGIRHRVPLFELGMSPRGLARCAGQWTVRLFPSLRGRLVVHEKQAVHGLFARHGWSVPGVYITDEGKDGSNYFVYHLARSYDA